MITREREKSKLNINQIASNLWTTCVDIDLSSELLSHSEIKNCWSQCR